MISLGLAWGKGAQFRSDVVPQIGLDVSFHATIYNYNVVGKLAIYRNTYW
jgi:hypothetical protein